MSKKKWNSRSPIEKGLIIGGSVLSTILVFKITKSISQTIAQNKIARDYAKALEQYNKGIGTGQIAPGTPPPAPPVIPSAKIIALTDQIADSVIGANIWYYPEVINSIVDLNAQELKELNERWNTKYTALAGGNLVWSLENEDAYIPQYGFNHAYIPAIDALKNAGY
tara:strand:+ start:2341 stop:2841 length:501 start_codon:yes stop_codon:yes gene_type:complete